MKVFVTGATGFIGSAIVQELLSAGHRVVGLARSDASADALASAGGEVYRGSLEDPEILKKAAADSDGVIHTAFIHDFSKMAATGEIDRLAIQAMGSALAGSGRPLVISSGVALLAGKTAIEDADPDPNASVRHRHGSEELTVALASRGVRSSVIRLSPSVHGEGDHGFVPYLIGIARQKGVSAYIGDGLNRWPAVHRLDAARLYRLAVENGSGGARYHGVADEGVPTREIAEAIGRNLNLPVVSKTLEEAVDHFGWMGQFFALDIPASSALTQERLGWLPTQPGLIADLDAGHYFR